MSRRSSLSSHGFGARASHARCWSLAAYVAGVAALLPSSQTALAQAAPARTAPAADSNEYAHTIERAVEQFQMRDFDRARELFRAAHKLQPSARTWRAVGLSDFESGRYTFAIVELEAALTDTRRPLDAQQRSEVQAVIAHARGFVGTLEVSIAPKEAKLFVDGVATSGDSFQLDAGDHVLRASAAGYVEFEQQVHVAPADVTKAVLTLEPVAAPDPVAASSESEASDDSTQRTAAWLVGGLGVAGVIVGSAFGVHSILKHGESDRYCAKDGICRDERGVSAMDTARSAGDISTVAFVASGLALGVSTVLFLTAPSTDSDRPERDRSAAQLHIGPGAVFVTGAF